MTFRDLRVTKFRQGETADTPVLFPSREDGYADIEERVVYITDELRVPLPVTTRWDIGVFSTPPTDAELTSAFGAPADLGINFKVIIDVNDSDTNMYMAVSNGTSWWLMTMTKAV